MIKPIEASLSSHSSTAPEDAKIIEATSPLILDDFDWETVDIDEFINLEGFN